VLRFRRGRALCDTHSDCDTASRTDTHADRHPDHDDDDICDGGGTGGGECTAGPDNWPFVMNTMQTNNDVFEAGDACQCGDVTGDGVMTMADVDEARAKLIQGIEPSIPDRCDVTGTPECGVDDIFMLDRAAKGLSATIQNSCAAYFGP
jgi:hypothetical protein